jgi:hypothetical protein
MGRPGGTGLPAAQMVSAVRTAGPSARGRAGGPPPCLLSPAYPVPWAAWPGTGDQTWIVAWMVRRRAG